MNVDVLLSPLSKSQEDGPGVIPSMGQVRYIYLDEWLIFMGSMWVYHTLDGMGQVVALSIDMVDFS